MNFVTDFADAALVLPLVLAVGLALALGGWPRGAAAWVGSTGITFAVVLLAKLVTHACHPLPFLALNSPSGHTAAAAVAAGGLLALLAPRSWSAPLTAAAGALLAAMLIGATRVELGVHSRSDVLAGALIGMAGAVLMAGLAGRRPRAFRRVLPLAAVVAAVIVFHGARLHAEDTIVRLSHLIWPLTLCRATGVR